MFPESLDIWINSIGENILKNRIAPIRLDIDITNRCNNDCIMCFSRNLPQTSLDIEHITSIIEDFAALGGMSVRLTGGGDCLTHPDIVSILELVGKNNLLLTIETNGDILCSPEIAEAVAKHVHHLRISVDSADTKSRQVIHRPINAEWTYEAILSNICDIRGRVAKLGRDSALFIGATFLILPENYSQVSKFLNDMEIIGVNWVAVRRIIDRSIYILMPEVLRKVEFQLSGRKKDCKLHIEPQYNIVLEPYKYISTCWISKARLIVLADGTLHLCCLARNCLHPHSFIGHLSDNVKPLARLLNQKSARIASFFSDAPKQCQVCIDYDNNISLSNIAWMIKKESNINFQKSLVTPGQITRFVGVDIWGIAQLQLAPASYEYFLRCKPVLISEGFESVQQNGGPYDYK